MASSLSGAGAVVVDWRFCALGERMEQLIVDYIKSKQPSSVTLWELRDRIRGFAGEGVIATENNLCLCQGVSLEARDAVMRLQWGRRIRFDFVEPHICEIDGAPMGRWLPNTVDPSAKHATLQLIPVKVVLLDVSD